MSIMKPIRTGGSLLERAAMAYDFGAELRGDPVVPDVPQRPVVPTPAPTPRYESAPRPVAHQPAAQPHAPAAGVAPIDRDLLSRQGMLVPGASVTMLAEEFRLIKRQLLLTARAVKAAAGDRSRTILVCSPNPNEGKTYCSINLALSLAAERDTEVLLIDADFAKPDVMTRLGLSEGPGLLDALANPQVDVEACIVRTDIPQFSVLPAGAKSNLDTELLASERTGALLAELLDADPRRLVIFDSPPALAASPAATLALQVGQVMLVVRADRTGEADIRAAVGLLAGCEHIQLVLNAVTYAPGGKRFGSYYDPEEPR